MLYLHKLLPALFLPIGVTLLLLGVGLILRKRILCWLGIGILYFLSTGVVSGKIMGWIERAGEPASLQARSGGGATQVSRREVEGVERADAIVVLSGMLQDRKDVNLGEWSDAVDRFEGGVELFKAGKAPLLIFTGGYVPWRPEDRPEGEILKQRAVKLGVPKEKIQVTGKVGNTAQEAESVKVLLESLERREAEGGRRENKQLTANGQQPTKPVGSKQWVVGCKPRIILVTSAFHMRRGKMLFERQGFEVEPFPVDFHTSDRPTLNILSFIPSAQALAKSETAMREGIGILYYSIIKR